MFDNNDKSLLSVRTVVNVVTGILLALFVIGGIVCIVIGADKEETLMIVVGILCVLVGALISWLFWVFMRLILSFLCDVKLIRNKLYGNSNDGLNVFIVGAQKSAYEESNTAQPRSKPNNGESDKMKLLRDLKGLYDSGAIDEEEYTRAKNDLLK